ncbi:unnamed protein product [Chilo suppressalis]|uniref:Programmed cell death protein 7 n=1 Tax=Chilo suppressalis TaxID=168631 RepID=A0ABN8L852_CHISP|nr:unnamed protein product [Chilo suppressalis]
MSYNHNFYNDQSYGNQFTFQSNFRPPFIPPPPPQPRFYMPPPVVTQAPVPNIISDQDFVNNFMNGFAEEKKAKKPKYVSIHQVRDMLRDLVMELNDIKEKEKQLSQKIKTYSDDEWAKTFGEINHKKDFINKCLSEITDSHVGELRMLMAKRAAKRLRLKRRNTERKREKEERIQQLKEKSRKIDENLQKIKDSINKAKQEEEAKLQADMVLKEVVRKKQDARKFINKFDALKKLRKARHNTAKGRGEDVSEKESEDFMTKIDNLKALWIQKLSDYEREEADLQKKLSESNDKNTEVNETEKIITSNLEQWREELFGEKDLAPQFDFNGDLGRFVEVRLSLRMEEEGRDPPRGPSADWRVLTTADAAGTNSLTGLPKHGDRDSEFGHPSNDRPLRKFLNFNDRSRTRLLPAPSSSSIFNLT